MTMNPRGTVERLGRISYEVRKVEVCEKYGITQET